MAVKYKIIYKTCENIGSAEIPGMNFEQAGKFAILQ
jgi:hypothetical protein